MISNEDEAVTHHISVYDLDGKSVLEKDFTMGIQVWNFLRTMRFVLQMKTHVIYTPYMGYINSIMSLNRHCIRSFFGGWRAELYIDTGRYNRKIRLK